MSEISIIESKNNMSEYMRSVILFNNVLTVSTKDGGIVVVSQADYDTLIKAINKDS